MKRAGAVSSRPLGRRTVRCWAPSGGGRWLGADSSGRRSATRSPRSLSRNARDVQVIDYRVERPRHEKRTMDLAMKDPPSESDRLVERLRGGDRSALTELFQLHRDRLRQMVELRIDARLPEPG